MTYRMLIILQVTDAAKFNGDDTQTPFGHVWINEGLDK